MIVGFIPCAGTNERWGGGLKELLPIKEGKWLLDNAIHTLLHAGCDHIVIASSSKKISAHAEHIFRIGLNSKCSFILGASTMWGTILEYIKEFPHDTTIMMMPDTITDFGNWTPGAFDIEIGLFETKSPDRFSVFHNGMFITKPTMFQGTTQECWGILSWSHKVSLYWVNGDFVSYDDAINKAVSRFYHKTFRLPYYYDFASFNDYQSFLRGTNDNVS